MLDEYFSMAVLGLASSYMALQYLTECFCSGHSEAFDFLSYQHWLEVSVAATLVSLDCPVWVRDSLYYWFHGHEHQQCLLQHQMVHEQFRVLRMERQVHDCIELIQVVYPAYSMEHRWYRYFSYLVPFFPLVSDLVIASNLASFH